MDTAIGASGNGLCFACSHTWDPSVPQPEPPARVEPTPANVVEEHPEPFGGVKDDRTGVELHELIGGTATLEGGQVATVISFTEDDRVIVRLRNDDLQDVSLADVERIVPPLPPVVEVAVEIDENDPPPGIAAVLHLAKLIVKAGIASVRNEGGQAVPAVPPVDWLPKDRAMFPVVEQACAVAVGMLITTFELDPADLLGMIGDVGGEL